MSETSSFVCVPLELFGIAIWADALETLSIKSATATTVPNHDVLSLLTGEKPLAGPQIELRDITRSLGAALRIVSQQVVKLPSAGSRQGYSGKEASFKLESVVALLRWRPTKVNGRPSATRRAMLAGIYGWFTEGFDTADLKDAKALLDDLSD